MDKLPQLRLLATGLLLAAAAASAAGQTESKEQASQLNRQFQAAVADYKAGRLPEAATKLEDLMPQLSNTFEAQELVGLVYAAQSEDAKAEVHLGIAVRLEPSSAAARTNLATTLWHEGKSDRAEEEFRKAIALRPEDFKANHDLAELYIQREKLTDAIPLLETAEKTDPSSYDNGYDLALSYFLSGRLTDARQQIQNLLPLKNRGELHNLLGQIEEKEARFLDAANQFKTAAELDPSEDNLFAWGSELLLHRAYDPAIQVFEKASQRYPNSPRLLIGLGMALDLRGNYDGAVKALLAAADLNPTDARCYLYLSKAYDASPGQADDVIRRFQRYAELQPANGLAQYYYAMSLLKGKPREDSAVNLELVRSLLQKAAALDTTLAEPHFELGNLYADQHEYVKSIPEYKRALELNPNLPDAHYRLGQNYVHLGEKDQAQSEFAAYQRLRAQYLADVDKKKAEVQQFVYAEKDVPATKQ